MKPSRKRPLASAINGNIMKKEQPEYLYMFIEIFLNSQNVLSHLVVHYNRKKPLRNTVYRVRNDYVSEKHAVLSKQGHD